jgi:hypothetical protein
MTQLVLHAISRVMRRLYTALGCVFYAVSISSHSMPDIFSIDQRHPSTGCDWSASEGAGVPITTKCARLVVCTLSNRILKWLASRDSITVE